ncbi:MAG TPA: acyltransferase [Gemmatimonadales bacterium]|nr:acyltransferase [Gemmatimonadales bacterium]
MGAPERTGRRPAVSSADAAARLQTLMAGEHLPGLDGLRCIGFLVVIGTHAGFRLYGDLGLLAFFVFSGLLITWLLLREHDGTGAISIPRFYLRRTFRIFPAYYVFLAFTLTLDLMRGDSRINDLILPSLTYTLNYWQAFNGHTTASVAHAWSLGVEEQFYLLWPLGLALLLRLGGRTAAVRGLLVVCGLTLLWRVVAHFALGLPEHYIYNAFDTRMDALLAGCLLAVLLTADRTRRAVARVAGTPGWALVTLAALLGSRILLPESYHLTLGLTVDTVLIAVLIVQVFAHSGHPAFRWLELPQVRFIGMITYPMYLYHQWALGVAGHLPGGAASTWLLLLYGIGVSIGFGAVSWYLVEKPALRMRNQVTRWMDRRAARAAHQAA